MSHSGLIETAMLTDARTALICARLHLRGGKRHLRKGLEAAGVAAMYDSVFFGMRYYIAKHKGCASIVRDTDLWDCSALFHALARAGVFQDRLAFNRFSLIVELALWHGSVPVDAGEVLVEVEKLLTQLGVIPSNKNIAPRASRSGSPLSLV